MELELARDGLAELRGGGLAAHVRRVDAGRQDSLHRTQYRRGRIGQAQMLEHHRRIADAARPGRGVQRDERAYLRRASAEWRLVYNPAKLQPEAPGGRYAIGELEFYDLRSDPREHDNLASRRPDLVERLRGDLLAWKARSLREAGAPNQVIDAETRQELKALGYIVN